MSLGKTVKIVTGSTTSLMPRLGLGTWKSDVGSVRAAVSAALLFGYRHVDAAWVSSLNNIIIYNSYYL